MIRFWLVLTLVFASRYVALGDDVDLPTAEEFSVPKVVERLARRIEPELAGKPERLPHRVDAAGFAKYLAGKRVRIKSDQKTGDLTIPAGASLKWSSSDDQTVMVELPTGKHVKLPIASCEAHRDTAADIDKIIAKGKQVL